MLTDQSTDRQTLRDNNRCLQFYESAYTVHSSGGEIYLYLLAMEVFYLLDRRYIKVNFKQYVSYVTVRIRTKNFQIRECFATTLAISV
jgi:hypothetical protein